MVIPSTFPQATSVAHSNTTPNDKTSHSHDNFRDSCFPDYIETPYHLHQLAVLLLDVATYLSALDVYSPPSIRCFNL
ncbi:hypothetical protein BJV78DRAFT_1354917, partial [Lactifluus subvellereus]